MHAVLGCGRSGNAAEDTGVDDLMAAAADEEEDDDDDAEDGDDGDDDGDGDGGLIAGVWAQKRAQMCDQVRATHLQSCC
jgi:hypothetical protein